MNFELACNWDPELLDRLEDYPKVELFGGIPGSVVAGGRASFVAPEVTEARAARYIKDARDRGHRFNFLLNASCLDNREYRKDEYKKIIEHVKWVEDTGADAVTVTIPYLMQLVRRHAPSLKVYVSSWARVESVRRAQHYAEMGVDAIILSEELNRDFRTLEAIRRAVDTRLVLVANVGCLYGCPRSYYHANVMTHGSQGGHASEGFMVDHCYFSCTMKKMDDPVELVKVRWIRPEDVEDYEMAGIDTLKIIDRYKTTDALVSYLDAYVNRSYKGNIVDLLNLPRKKAFLPANVKYIMRDEFINTGKLMEYADITDFAVSEYLVLDNTKIPGNFLSFFKTKDCATSDCAECGFCELIAKKAVTVEAGPLSSQVKKYRALLESLESGSIYEEDEAGESNFDWDKGAREMHEALMAIVPKVFKSAARRRVEAHISRLVEGSSLGKVGVDEVFAAWESSTPGPFRGEVKKKIRELAGS